PTGSPTSSPSGEVMDRTGWPGSITVVQMPNENNPNAGQKHEEFSRAMSEYLGVEIKEMEGTDYSVGIEGMASGNIDVMLVSPMSYYQAKERAGAELLVSTPMAEDYHTAFITQADNDDINSLKDLKGKSFAFVDQASSSGYMYPKAKLVKDLELDPSLVENSGYFFSTVAFAGQHQSVATGVSMGDYDAGAVAASVMDQMAQAGALDASTLKVIGQTDTIPNPAYVVRGSLPQTLKDEINAFFLQFNDGSYFEAVHGDKDIRFVDVTEDDYKIIYDTLETLGIDEKE
ncbi:MAG TPA: phosphate/phosphite/phosphonate ABC transporter substrate-binding protein, partial [Pseudoflavonifractor sp.]|nr:phosphate/phosphite/phosphonate ABC transporter substrate-binding protein [Pseudoflavonifractor sp.]